MKYGDENIDSFDRTKDIAKIEELKNEADNFLINNTTKSIEDLSATADELLKKLQENSSNNNS